jgi:hypothetical protein
MPGLQAHRGQGQGQYLAPNKSESELSAVQRPRGKQNTTADVGKQRGFKGQGFPRLQDQLKQSTDSSRPFQFLSSLGNKEAETVELIHHGHDHGMLKRESALGLAPRQHGPPEELQPMSKSQVKIFTQLDVSKPIRSPAKGQEAAFANGFVIEQVVPALDLKA